MKVSRYAVLALATAVAFGFAMSPVMAQDSTPTQSAQDASKDAMKSSSDAMKSSSDSMKSDANSATSGQHHKKQHSGSGTKKSGEPASTSSAGH
ncbi:hypothetical protein [Dyella sp. C9]|uniref:hypothetical protein n=1 Tax=Dyella sp. C9 TaxID=2202154 RepID=UPI000DEFF812|nr:hypothetical protein [Dyella sp. C9]